MIGLDTNILVRYLTQDDPVQARMATRTIEQAADRGESFHITEFVLCELVWVLEDAYGYSRDTIAEVLERILRTAPFRFRNKDALWRALHEYRVGKADFSDYLIGQLAREAGCEQTLTFDRSLRKHPSFQVL